jgi:hypothetical protein
LGGDVQGEDAVHDAIRSLQLRLGAADAIARALRVHGSGSEEVLWAALFSLAVLVREGSAPNRPAVRAAASAGLLPLLQSCMGHYKVSVHNSPPASFAITWAVLQADVKRWAVDTSR